MEIEAATEEALFTDALHALGELVADDVSGPQEWREVMVNGHERAVLLVLWLD